MSRRRRKRRMMMGCGDRRSGRMVALEDRGVLHSGVRELADTPRLRDVCGGRALWAVLEVLCGG